MKPEIEKKINEQIRHKLLQLPSFVCEYVYSLEYRGRQIRSRLEYTKDVTLFLEFLIFSGLSDKKEIIDISPLEMEKIRERDIWSFLSYLTRYEKTFLSSSGNIISQEFTNSEVGKSRKIVSLKDFFSYLYSENIIEKDITAKINLKVNKKVNIKDRLSPEEITALFDVILDDLNIENARQKAFHQKVKYRDYIIILILAYTGIRVSELIQLDMSDVSLKDEAMVVYRKGGDQEKITIPSIVMKDLREYLIDRKEMNLKTNALFVSLQEKRINERTVNNMIDKYRIRAGIDIKVTPHVFRRTFGTEHYNRYQDMYLTAQVMGHTSAETTRKYYADPAEERKIKSMQEFSYSEKETETIGEKESSFTKEELLKMLEKYD